MADPIRFRAAVLGDPIDHSLSPVLHNAGYRALGLDDWDYGRIRCAEQDLDSIVGGADESYRGFSVTMPAKFAALNFADTATTRATRIGSANTLVRTADGTWLADNTDCDGLTGALKELGITQDTHPRNAVIIGAGGTARPAVWALAHTGVTHVTIINRSDRSDEYKELAEHLGIELIFHSLADGFTPCENTDVVISTVPSKAVEDHAEQIVHAPLIDVIYHPWPTGLVATARTKSIPAVGGHVMLAHQAYTQFEHFTGQPAPQDAMWAALQQELDHEN